MTLNQEDDANILVAPRTILLPSCYGISFLSQEVGIHSSQSNEQDRVEGYTFLANERYRLFEQGERDRHSWK